MTKNDLSGIYAITPNDLEERVLLTRVTEILESGIKLLQYRDKFRPKKEKLVISLELRRICNQFGSLLIINDEIELAKEVKADGVHLGQNDTSYRKAREFLGPKFIIGISCQNNLNFALKAELEGANYVAFGSAFKSKTKPEAVKCSLEDLRKFSKKLKTPVAAIGGINFENLLKVTETGVDMLAISSGLFDENNLVNLTSLLKKV